MLTYSDVQTFLTARLTALGYGSTKPMPLLDPGPATLAKLQKKTPDAMVLSSVGNGVGLTTEGAYDRPFITTRVLGPQNDYAGAETLAQDLDRIWLAVTNQAVGNTRVLYVTRNAPPQLVDFDADDRYHFQTTYIAEATR